MARTLAANSMFVDTESTWSRNLHWLDRLASMAEARRIVVGSDVEGLLQAVDEAVTRRDN